MDIHPKRLILFGFFLVLFGFVAPFLMVLRVIDSTLWLNLLSYSASLAGLFMGIIGAAWYVRVNRS